MSFVDHINVAGDASNFYFVALTGVKSRSW